MLLKKGFGIIRDRKKATPEAANNRVKRLRAMFRWAMLSTNAELGISSNPARDVPKLKPLRKGGFPLWKPADLDKFEAATRSAPNHASPSRCSCSPARADPTWCS